MKIAVGSTNPVKVNATKKAFQKVWPKKKWEVVGLDINSKVSSQPMSDTESITGATNRAKGVLEQAKADFGVGIEGGLTKINGEWFDTAWMVIIDKKGKKGIGASISMPTPPTFMKKVHKGMEIGHIDDEVFKKKNSKHQQGHYGLMTKGLITREDGYIHGVISALTMFMHPSLFK